MLRIRSKNKCNFVREFKIVLYITYNYYRFIRLVVVEKLLSESCYLRYTSMAGISGCKS